MQDLAIILKGGLGLLPITGSMAMILIAIQAYKMKKMGKQFADCMVRRGVVHEIGIREPTQLRPYRHCVVKCSFQNGGDLVEIPYDSGDLKDIQAGEVIPLYFYPNGVVTVVAYDEGTVKKKLGQQVIALLVLCAVLSFFIPVVGLLLMNRTK